VASNLRCHAAWAIRSSIAGARRSERFSPLLQAEQHPPRHDERRWFHHSHEQPCTNGVGETLGAARHESRPTVVERVQAKLPDPLEPVACPGQDERAIGLNRGHWESLASSKGNDVAHRQPVKFGKDAIRTWTI
jgi:hypothetical protein